MLSIITIIGVIGLLMLLTAFTLNSFQKTHNGSYTYNILNCMGGIILAYYAITMNVLIFAILEAIWALVALYSISKRVHVFANTKEILVRKFEGL